MIICNYCDTAVYDNGYPSTTFYYEHCYGSRYFYRELVIRKWTKSKRPCCCASSEFVKPKSRLVPGYNRLEVKRRNMFHISGRLHKRIRAIRCNRLKAVRKDR